MQKLNLRLPPDMIEEARQEAAAMHVSLNTYILQALASYTPYTKGIRDRRENRASAAALPPPSAPATGSRPVPKVGRNQPCPCGSGKKYRHCHGDG